MKNPLDLLGHRYTAQRGQRWLLLIIVLGGLMLVSLVMMLGDYIGPWVWFGSFIVWALVCVIACLDFAIPILKEKK